MKKLGSSLTVFFLAAALLAGCGQGSSSQPAGSSGAGSSASASDGESAPENLNVTGYPIVKEPVTMNMMLNLNAARGVDPAQNEAFRFMKELTGINWEFTTVDSSAWKEKLSLMWVSDAMPDMVYSGVGTTADIMKYLKMGKLMDLAPYLPTYAPNATRYIEQNDDLKMAVYTPNGQAGGFFYGSMDVEEGAGQCPPEFLSVNRTWLDKLNLSMPTNAEEFYEVLKAFRDGDPNGNGQADEIGLAFNSWSAAGMRILLPWFGVMADSATNAYLDGDTIRYTPLTDEYREAVEYLRKLYAEGLIDKNIFTATSGEVIAKGSGAEPVYGALMSSAAFLVVGADRADEYEMAGLFKAPNGSEMWYTRAFPAGVGVGALTSSCKYPEAAVRWSDTFYDEAYKKIYWMGVEGEAYQVKSDGAWDWKYENTEDKTSNSVRARYTIQPSTSGPSICPSDWFLLADNTEKPVNDQRVKFAKDNMGKLRVALPTMYYEEGIATRNAELSAELNSYENEMFAKFIVGEVDIESGWKQFTDQLKKMGAEELTQNIQKTYDANKK